MIVMKFGGTSVEDAASIERVTEIIKARVALRPCIVVSAMGKTTSRLLQAAQASAAGDARTTLGIVADLKARHASEARQLIKSNWSAFDFIEQYFAELKKLLEGLAILGEVPPRGLDKILAYGELLSSAIVSDALDERGIASQLVDARKLLITDDRFGGASPLFDIANAKIVATLAPLIAENRVPVLQGFIGATREGATTTLGFEGSDYTAAIIGAAMDADDIQIWKDVSGLMTTDPRLYKAARTVKACSFAEAAALTYFGAKVLHPKAIYPAARKNIPVHIYNSKLPQATGTAISATAPLCKNAIKSIAFLRPVTILKATIETISEEEQIFLPEDSLKTIINTMIKRRVTPLLTAVSGLNTAFVMDAKALDETTERDLLNDIAKFTSASVERDRAIITLVGAGLAQNARISGRVFNALEAVEVNAVLHGSSPIMMNVVIAAQDVEAVIARLHEAFFADFDREVFE
ncbi:MAG: aspartate kinase [Acidobacteria bacterium]|nr:aspartate kinase [Acidobacteriota bacterium]